MNPILLNAIRASQAAANWWDGLTNVVAVYQPIGAASLAASYVNLANPGTFDAAPGVAPTWSAATGWICSNTSLLTGISGVSVGAGGWSLIVRFSNAASNNSVAGIYTASNNSFAIFPSLASRVYYTTKVDNFMTPALTAGVLAIAGPVGYRNGAADLALSGTGSVTGDIIIGARNTSTSEYWSGNIQAVAICSSVQSAAQIATVSAAMAALT
jgi:hypothetical protein